MRYQLQIFIHVCPHTHVQTHIHACVHTQHTPPPQKEPSEMKTHPRSSVSVCLGDECLRGKQENDTLTALTGCLQNGSVTNLEGRSCLRDLSTFLMWIVSLGIFITVITAWQRMLKANASFTMYFYCYSRNQSESIFLKTSTLSKTHIFSFKASCSNTSP